MTSTVLTLILVLLMLVALAGALRRLGRDELDEGPPRCLDPLDSSTSAGSYRPLSRLFSAEDSAFLARSGDRGKKLAARLGSARARVLRLYLRQIRADFDGVWLLARQVAPQSSDPNFGFWIAKQWMIFHAALALVYVRSWLGWRIPVPLHVVGLVNSLDAFRSGVRAVLQQVDPATSKGSYPRDSRLA